MPKRPDTTEAVAPPIIIEHRVDRFRQVLLSIIGIVLTGSMFFIAAKVDGALGQATKAANSAAQDGEILVNCTTPGHECYQRSKATTTQALAAINIFVAASAFCARTVPFSAKETVFENCIVVEATKIAESQQNNPQSPFYIPPQAKTPPTTTTTTTTPRTVRRASRSSASPTTTTTTRPPSTTTTTAAPPPTTTTTTTTCLLHVGPACVH